MYVWCVWYVLYVYFLPSPCSTGSLGAGTVVAGSPRLGVGGPPPPPLPPPAPPPPPPSTSKLSEEGATGTEGWTIPMEGTGGAEEGNGRTSPIFATGTEGGAG